MQNKFFRAEHLKEACGVFGIFAPQEELARITCYALYALQHRGQESAGIAISDGDTIHLEKGMGLVSEVFPSLGKFEHLQGLAAIGHVRSAVAGTNKPENAQPLLVRFHQGELAVAHNGNLVNAKELRQRLELDGSIFQTTTDSELVAHLIARCGRGELESSIADVLSYLRGSYAFLFLTENKLIGVRDPRGIRPLSLGKLGDHFVLASETCAFDTVGADFLRDVNPGEMVIIDREGMRSIQVFPRARSALCIFEYIYFARPDSNLNGKNVHLVRKRLGRRLAQEQPVEADIVTGVPDSSIAAASGYAEEIGLPYEVGLVKNRYIGRTFIQPTQARRDEGIKLKINPVKKIVEGKRVVIIDDSIVRGTTSMRLVSLLFKAGAKEVHLRIGSPPVISPCYYGINTPTYEELIGAHHSCEQIRRKIGATSLAYLSRKGMLEAIGLTAESACDACFSGEYPIWGG